MNDKVWSLNTETDKALEALAGLYERFELVNRDIADTDRKFDAEYEDLMVKVKALEAQKLEEIAVNTASDCRRTAMTFDEAGVTLSMSTGDRTENDEDHLQTSLALLAKILK